MRISRWLKSVKNTLGGREIRNMKTTMISFIHEVGQTPEMRFGDETSYADHCNFVEPLKRNSKRCDIKKVVEKVDTRGWFNIDKIQQQYKMYLFDDSLDFLFAGTCKKTSQSSSASKSSSVN